MAQIALPEAPQPAWHTAGLFADHYLLKRLPGAGPDLWPPESEARRAFLALVALWREWSERLVTASEEDCEDRFIGPALKALGYGFLPRRRLTGAGAQRYPDFLLFDSEARADAAFKEGGDAYPGALGLLEAKKWGLALDVAKGRDKSPHAQTRDYLADAPEAMTWALLSNGSQWRLYCRQDRASSTFQFNLAPVLGFAAGDALAEAAAFQQFRVFHALFRSAALQPDAQGRRPVDLARAGSVAFKAEVEHDLRVQVFGCVELLGHGLLTRSQNRLTEADLPLIYENALVLLYRLLFVLNAEARGLLPTQPKDKASDEFYHAFGLAHVRQELAGAGGVRRYSSDYSTALMERLRGLFNLINGVQASTVGPDKNDELGVPRYNGGLFDPTRHPQLEGWTVGDKTLAEVIRRLAFRRDKDGQQVSIDYLTLGERHLGSIYEGLLEHRLVPADGQAGAGGTGGELVVRLANDKGERKTSGAYYTPEDWVSYIVEHSLRPLLERADQTLGPRAEDAEPDDAYAQAVLHLNVCDPAMGSGHFLVEALGVMAEAIAIHPSTMPRPAYDREGRPLGEATDASTLAYWRRRVAEACIYGVDLNPLAVELAKLSLWLQTVDRVPLSFLDHHLRVGNSLIGARLADLPALPRPGKARPKPADRTEAQALQAGGKQLRQKRQTYASAVQLPLGFTATLGQAVEQAIAGILRIEGLATETLSGIKEKEQLWKRIAGETLAPFRAVADLWLAPWFGVDISDAAYQQALDEAAMAAGLLREAGEPYAAGKHFFHWELEFPDIFFDEQGRRRQDGGFDAVVGNPPWERIKLQENEFFAARSRAIATAPRAADRKRLIAALPEQDPVLWAEYQQAKADAEQTMAFIRGSGQFPLMGIGDTNLYAVFTERALELASPTGRVGLLVPSGIATDATTSGFFRKLVAEQRLAALLDFENRDKVFEDVDSRFKFSILLMAGAGDPQPTVRAGFFLRQIADAADPDRAFQLTPEDFALFNPNTLTCPIFRRRRDYQLTRRIYERVPVLVDKGKGEEGNPWGVRFQRMFDMTNDSHHFHTAAELEAAGCWLGVGNVYSRGAERWLPLYEAKMIHQYDHRYANAVAGDEKLVNTQASETVTAESKRDPSHSVMPRFWVPSSEVAVGGRVMLGFRDIARATDVRTCIATFFPLSGVSNKLPLLVVAAGPQTCLLANLNSFALDYAARSKVSSTSLNFFIVEQFPVLPPATYDADFHGVRLADWISRRVLELSYTAHDLKGLAEDLGYDGPPFAWDEERRLHLRCQLDALYFILYGLSREEAGEVMDTFPIVKRQDEARWGRFRTMELILAYHNALSAGNMDAWVKG